jgi:hypothetical protein
MVHARCLYAKTNDGFDGFEFCAPETCRLHLAGAWASAMDGLALQKVGLRPTFIQIQNAYLAKIT